MYATEAIHYRLIITYDIANCFASYCSILIADKSSKSFQLNLTTLSKKLKERMKKD